MPPAHAANPPRAYIIQHISLHTDAYPDFNILSAINMPVDGVSFADSADSYFAYAIDSSADLKSPYRTVLPEMLYDFTVTAIFRTDSQRGGYLFSVVNPLDTIVQLGVRLSPVVRQRWNATLVYADAQAQGDSAALATFELDYSRDWHQITFNVDNHQVALYVDCELRENRTVVRVPRELYFDSASTLYVAQAGKILGGQFEVS